MDLGAISNFLPFKPISRRTSSGRGASSGDQPGVSSGARLVGKLNFRSAASAALSTETFSRRRVAPEDSARSLSGFDSLKWRNLSLAISVCASRLGSRASHPVATSRAAMGVLLSLPPTPPFPSSAAWPRSGSCQAYRIVLLSRLKTRFAYSRADHTKETYSYRVLS